MTKRTEKHESTPAHCGEIIARWSVDIAAKATAVGDYATAITALALYSEIHGLVGKVVRS